MKKRLESLWFGIGAGGTVLTYYTTIKSEQDSKKVLDTLEAMQEVLEDKTIVPNNSASKNILDELREAFREFKQNSEEIYKRALDLESGKTKVNSPESYKELYQELANKADWSYRKSLELAEKLDISLNDTPNKFISLDQITNIISEYQEFLETLPFSQKCALFNIFCSFLILGCIINILTAFYGVVLINKITWIKNYNWLNNIIKVRNAFQTYYIIFNSIIIFIALGLSFHINILSLLH